MSDTEIQTGAEEVVATEKDVEVTADATNEDTAEEEVATPEQEEVAAE